MAEHTVVPDTGAGGGMEEIDVFGDDSLSLMNNFTTSILFQSVGLNRDTHSCIVSDLHIVWL